MALSEDTPPPNGRVVSHTSVEVDDGQTEKVDTFEVADIQEDMTLFCRRGEAMHRFDIVVEDERKQVLHFSFVNLFS